MVTALHRLGLRVVFDTVYNHTFHSGIDGELCTRCFLYCMLCACKATPLHLALNAAPVQHLL